jgi:hypothetical protein
MPSLYEEMKSAGLIDGSRYGDLYVYDEPESWDIINRHRENGIAVSPVRFISEIDGARLIELPFHNDQFFKKVRLTHDNFEENKVLAKDFIARHRVKLEATPVPENPYSSGDEWSKNAFHFHCLLTNAYGRVFTTYYSVGSDIVENYLNKKNTAFRIAVKGLSKKCIAYDDALREYSHKYKPDLKSILECLALDSRNVADGMYFEDWADNLGYDTDSRSAEKVYNNCREQHRDLSKFFGKSFNEFLQIEEDY